jgi:hypothetical protein
VLDINDMKGDLMQAQVGILRMYMYTNERERERERIKLAKEINSLKRIESR